MKRIAAVLLLAAFFLPLSSCTSTTAPDHKVEVQYHYAWSGFDPAEPGNYLLILAFAWPLATLATARRRGKLAAIGWWLELPLLMASTYLLYRWTWGQKAEIGSFAYGLGLASQAGAWLGEALDRLRTSLLRRLTPSYEG